MILQQCCHGAVGYSPWCHGRPWVQKTQRFAVGQSWPKMGPKWFANPPKNTKEFKNAWQISIQYQQSEHNGMKAINFCLEESFPLDGEMHPLEKQNPRNFHSNLFLSRLFPLKNKWPQQAEFSRSPTNSVHISPVAKVHWSLHLTFQVKKQQIQAFFSFWNFCCGATNNTEKTASSYYNFGKAQRAFFRRNNCYCCWFLRGSKLPKRLPPLHTWTLMLKKLGKTVCNACSCS